MTDARTRNQRLDDPGDVEVLPVAEGRKNLRAGQLMLYPNGHSVADMIRTIPPVQSMTVKTLRSTLAQHYGAEITCPVTTGHCLRAVVEAAYESFSNGTPIAEVTPVWRVLEPKSPTLKKLSYDPAFILEQRTREALA